MPLLIGLAHQAEVLVEQVVALETKEPVREFSLPWPNEPLNRDPAVVVADPRGHSPEELECPHVAVLERLGALTGISPNEHRVGVRQAHHEQRRLHRLTVEKDHRLPEVDLGLTQRMT